MTHDPYLPSETDRRATMPRLARRQAIRLGILGGLVGAGMALVQEGLRRKINDSLDLATAPGQRSGTAVLLPPAAVRLWPQPTATTEAEPTVTPQARPDPRPSQPTLETADAVPTWRVTQPRLVMQEEWGAASAGGIFIPQTPRKITLHHEGVYFDGSLPAARYLRNVQHWSITNRKWPDIPYHFMIDLDGNIYEGRPLTARGDTNTAYDLQDHALIAVLGKYDAHEQEPTPAQLDAIIAIMAWIADTHTISPSLIFGHRDFIPVNRKGEHIDTRTGERITCPGDNLYRYLADGTIQQGVARLLAPRRFRYEQNTPG